MISRSVLATNDRFPFTGRKVDVGGEAKAVHRVDGHLAGGIEIFFIGSDAPEPDADAGQAGRGALANVSCVMFSTGMRAVRCFS